MLVAFLMQINANKQEVRIIKETNIFYLSSDWRKKRKQILDRDNNECQRCKQEGRASTANTVHHIKHLDKCPEFALTDSNLISLCEVCHNEVHPEKLDAMLKDKRIDKFYVEERWE